MAPTRRTAKAPEPSGPPSLTVPRAQAAEVLNRHAAEGRVLLAEAEPIVDTAAWEEWSERFDRWREVVYMALRRLYTTDEPGEGFKRVVSHIFRRIGQSNQETFDFQVEVIKKGVNKLVGFVEALEYVEAPDEASATKPTPADLGHTANTSVFVVHGRDDAMRESAARVLTRLGFEPIILAEQPNQGATLIEKFERNAVDVGFAVVLLSPDDYGRNPEDAALPDAPNRARQNVVLELGYFMGRLGRGRVAALYRSGVELPSDIHGLAYLQFDDGGAWKFKLAQELAAAGYEVDFNRLK